jgi:hypothetical protein
MVAGTWSSAWCYDGALRGVLAVAREGNVRRRAWAADGKFGMGRFVAKQTSDISEDARKRTVSTFTPADLCRVHVDAMDCPDVDPRSAHCRHCLDLLLSNRAALQRSALPTHLRVCVRRLRAGRSLLASLATERKRQPAVAVNPAGGPVPIEIPLPVQIGQNRSVMIGRSPGSWSELPQRLVRQRAECAQPAPHLNAAEPTPRAVADHRPMSGPSVRNSLREPRVRSRGLE